MLGPGPSTLPSYEDALDQPISHPPPPEYFDTMAIRPSDSVQCCFTFLDFIPKSNKRTISDTIIDINKWLLDHPDMEIRCVEVIDRMETVSSVDNNHDCRCGVSGHASSSHNLVKVLRVWLAPRLASSRTPPQQLDYFGSVLARSVSHCSQQNFAYLFSHVNQLISSPWIEGHIVSIHCDWMPVTDGSTTLTITESAVVAVEKLNTLPMCCLLRVFYAKAMPSFEDIGYVEFPYFNFEDAFTFASRYMAESFRKDCRLLNLQFCLHPKDDENGIFVGPLTKGSTSWRGILRMFFAQSRVPSPVQCERLFLACRTFPATDLDSVRQDLLLWIQRSSAAIVGVESVSSLTNQLLPFATTSTSIRVYFNDVGDNVGQSDDNRLMCSIQ